MKMTAVVQPSAGGTDTLHLGKVDRPVPQPGQLLVRVRAAGVNRADIVQREGHYPPPPGASCLLGLEIAGEVVSLGGKSQFKKGDAVLGLVAGGGYAEYVLLDEALAVAKPDSMEWVEAASLPEAWMTAWFNLIEIGGLQTGERVLIHAGASGVGAASIQLASLMGAAVFASAGSEDKLTFCRQMGAECLYNWRELNGFSQEVRQWGGADLILDPVGGSYLAENIACMNTDGRLLLIGVMGGTVSSINLAQILIKRLTLRGSTLRNQPLAVKAGLAAALSTRVLPAMVAGQLSITVDAVFPLSQVCEAHKHMEGNRNLGKVVLSV